MSRLLTIIGAANIKNRISNSVGAGAVAGTPGTLPSPWAALGGAGLTLTVVGSGVADGQKFVDVQWSGTTSSTAGIQLDFITSTTGIPTAFDQDEILHVGLAIVGGDTTNITSIALVHRIGDASGTFISSPSGSDIKSSLTSTIQRFSFYRRVTDAAARYIKPRFQIAYGSGVLIDITMRFSLPQLERDFVAGHIVRTY